MKNKLAYLGFLGFFGFLGFYYLFEGVQFMFGFFGFFFYAKIVPDELFLLHVRKATTRAFFVGVIVTAPIMVISFAIENSAWLRFLLTIPFSVSMVIFVISLQIFEQREKKGLEEDGVIN
ncbi:DUF3796 domain-containing protein [Priestia flexa]|uniref:DUF3796 domain-containing protein n=1 Tax=Priestia flexa TaxID=86664 RepID=UPI000953A879|nr:DUF3796 domain-containing protein [Priestia flexa]SIR56321.1 Protein of unknown function [Priestia flexa]